uniref:Uncharacterized protein n=1 Tax=Botrytis cinerea binarnavirus 5 TaxID=2802529 RepID=A0A8A8QIC8_9VIRU|nr:hypothetical protein [Botrytis cinerea binarnavirus 5]
MLWNPLEYITDEPVTHVLDLDELTHLGRETSRIAEQQDVIITQATSKVVGREVGDDRACLCRTVFPLVASLMAQEKVVHMVTSWPDTSIRRKSWNFCETTSGPLTDPSQGFDFVRKTGDFSNLGFNDSVILRIISDVQKGSGDDHSSTQPGKMSMLGSRLATPRRENRKYWMLASIFQDAMLCTHKASEPKYLPPVMGGTGVTALFDNPNNVFLYVLAYKGGSYRRIYATACGEMRDYLYNLERGVQSAPILCPRLREKQEYFWGTYDNFVFVPRESAVTNGLTPPEPLYERTGGQNLYQNFENRLIRTRHIVTRRQAQVEWEHTRRLESIFHGVFDNMEKFSSLDKERSKTLRARYDGALNANAALQNLLNREAGRGDAMKLMGSDNFLTVTSGKLDFTREDASWVYMNGQGENYSLRDVSLSEDMFVREEVSLEETFKVGGLPLRPFMVTGAKQRLTKTKVGLYNISSTMEEWAEDLIGRLLTERSLRGRPLRPVELGPIFMVNPEWVNDDTGLIGKCHELFSNSKGARQEVCLVSGDRKLANKMAETCNVKVIRLSPQEFVRLARLDGIEISSNTPLSFMERHVGKRQILVDTGSVSAASTKMVEERGVQYNRVVRSTGWSGHTRISEVTLSRVYRVNMRLETHVPVTRPKIWRSGSRPGESVYSSHESWKETRSGRSSSSSWWRTGSTPELPSRTKRKGGLIE